MTGKQRYVSDELTHFVGRSLGPNEDAQYSLLRAILGEGRLTSSPKSTHDIGELTVNPTAAVFEEQFQLQCVCFCDIPVEDLPIHMTKYSRFGLSFLKSFLVKKGANPVFYVAVDGIDVLYAGVPEEAAVLNEAMARHQAGEITIDQFGEAVQRFKEAYETKAFRYIDRKGLWALGLRLFHRIISKQALAAKDTWELWVFLSNHIFAFVKPFEAHLAEDHPDSYYMEREWRISGNLRFTLNDVRRILLPESHTERFRRDFPQYKGQLSFAP